MVINLERLEKLCKGEEEKKQKYLRQFLELVSPRLEVIDSGLKKGDREKIRQTIHFLAPQLTFFGLPEFATILENLETSPSLENFDRQRNPIESAIHKINTAVVEIEDILKNPQNQSDE